MDEVRIGVIDQGAERLYVGPGAELRLLVHGCICTEATSYFDVSHPERPSTMRIPGRATRAFVEDLRWVLHGDDEQIEGRYGSGRVRWRHDGDWVRAVPSGACRTGERDPALRWRLPWWHALLEDVEGLLLSEGLRTRPVGRAPVESMGDRLFSPRRAT